LEEYIEFRKDVQAVLMALERLTNKVGAPSNDAHLASRCPFAYPLNTVTGCIAVLPIAKFQWAVAHDLHRPFPPELYCMGRLPGFKDQPPVFYLDRAQKRAEAAARSADDSAGKIGDLAKAKQSFGALTLPTFDYATAPPEIWLRDGEPEVVPRDTPKSAPGEAAPSKDKASLGGKSEAFGVRNPSGKPTVKKSSSARDIRCPDDLSRYDQSMVSDAEYFHLVDCVMRSVGLEPNSKTKSVEPGKVGVWEDILKIRRVTVDWDVARSMGAAPGTFQMTLSAMEQDRPGEPLAVETEGGLMSYERKAVRTMHGVKSEPASSEV
jgi:hypothetical protein